MESELITKIVDWLNQFDYFTAQKHLDPTEYQIIPSYGNMLSFLKISQELTKVGDSEEARILGERWVTGIKSHKIT